MAKTFGSKIRERRKQLRLTLEKVADLIGSTKNYVWELEKKENARPSAETVIKLSKALSLPPEYLIDDDKAEPFNDEYDDSFFQDYLQLSIKNKQLIRRFVETLQDVESEILDTDRQSLESISALVGEEEDLGATLGTFVQLKRRQLGLSVHDLAQKGRVNVSEVSKIESDMFYLPKPRTIHQLAIFFDISPEALIKLSNTSASASKIAKSKKVKFAAHADNLSNLSEEEKKILNQYIEYIDSLISE